MTIELKNKVFLSVIIPVYNEGGRILPPLKETAEFLQKQNYQSEIIVVNDGSWDNTTKIISNFQLLISKQFPKSQFPISIKLIDNKINRGKGAVVKQGMLAATGEWRLFMDADNSTPVSEVEKLLAAAAEQQTEIIIGSRWLDSKTQIQKQPLSRIVVSRLGNWLIQGLFLPGIKDTQCGFKLFSAAATEKIFPRQTTEHWRFDIEVLYLAKKMGYKILEMPVVWKHVEGSKINSITKETRQSLLDVLAILMNVWQGKYKLKTKNF